MQMTQILEDCGFQINEVHLFERPTPLPNGFHVWLQTFAGAFLDRLPSSADRAKVLLETADAWESEYRQTHTDGMQQSSRQEHVLDYVRLRFQAVKPVAA